MIIRLLAAFAIIAGLAALAAWFARHPGTVMLRWQDYTLETSVGVMLAAVALLAILVAILLRLLAVLQGAPSLFGRRRRARRRRQGYAALTRGLVAVAAGDAAEARRQSQRVEELLADQPALRRLLAAEAAQLAGDETAARHSFALMLKQRETELLGVRGLLAVAEHEGDRDRALALARRANELRPGVPWAIDKQFELEIGQGDWTAAETTAQQAEKTKAWPAETARRRRAVVLLEQSREAEAAGDPRAAAARAEEALALDPAFGAAALRLATLLVAGGHEKRARKTIEAAWSRAAPGTPHAALARLYLTLGAGDDALRRLKHMEHLAGLAPALRDSHLAAARAALDAKLWGQARRHLKEALAGGVSAGACRLMAELEEAEHGDGAAARSWLARAQEADAEPGWLCTRCGAQADGWTARCGYCGAFDSLEWKVPPRVAALPPAQAAEAAKTALTSDAADTADAPEQPARGDALPAPG